MALPKFCACLLTLLLVVCTPSESLNGRRPQPSQAIIYDAIYDFERFYYKTNPNVTVVSGFTGTRCNTRGVLKIALADNSTDPNRRRVVIDLGFYFPRGLVFHLGDSSTNNGTGGDAGTQSNDAEVLGLGTTFTGYINRNGGNALAFNISKLYSSRMTLLVADGSMTWISNDNNNINTYSNPNFFALNGQPDTVGPVNYDLYLGVNQAISGTGKFGVGLCRIGIKFIKEI